MRALIVGIGFVGEALADQLHSDGHFVLGLTHSAESRDRLRASKPYEIERADVSQEDSLREAIASQADFNFIVHCASSGRSGADAYRLVHQSGCQNLLSVLPMARLLFTSSTSVYAQTDGSWVDENSLAQPNRETGIILRATEDLVLSSGGVVARLAGIYGQGRSVILRKFLEGSAIIEGDGGRFINQVHRDDIVSALSLLLSSNELPLPRVYNVVDDGHQTQRGLLSWLAEHFDQPLPPVGKPDFNRKRGWTHKRVSNAKLKALGWSLRYPRFQDAVLAGTA